MTSVYLPGTLDELWDIMAENPDARMYAGGTDLLVKTRSQAMKPTCLVCLERVEPLRGVRDSGEELFIGAATTHSRLLASDLVAEHFPVLIAAVSVLGSPPIRNMGTIGGNIVTASPAADTLPALWVLDAEVELATAADRRRVRVSEFVTGPGTVDLRQGEIVTGVWLPKATEGLSGPQRTVTLISPLAEKNQGDVQHLESCDQQERPIPGVPMKIVHCPATSGSWQVIEVLGDGGLGEGPSFKKGLPPNTHFHTKGFPQGSSPMTPPWVVHHYEKVGRRKAQACAVASMAAVMVISEAGRIENIRLAWGSVGPTVIRSDAVERALAGQILCLDTLRGVSHLVEQAVSPIDDVRAGSRYRRTVSAGLVLRLSEYAREDR